LYIKSAQIGSVDTAGRKTWPWINADGADQERSSFFAKDIATEHTEKNEIFLIRVIRANPRQILFLCVLCDYGVLRSLVSETENRPEGKPHVMLSLAKCAGVDVIELDGSDRDVFVDPDIEPAAGTITKIRLRELEVLTAKRQFRFDCRRTDQYPDKGHEPFVSSIRNLRTDKVYLPRDFFRQIPFRHLGT